MTTGGNPRQDPYIEHLDFLLSSFTDNGKSLRGFTINPQELAITMLTSGLLANSKLMISPEDAIKSAFDIHKRINITLLIIKISNLQQKLKMFLRKDHLK